MNACGLRSGVVNRRQRLRQQLDDTKKRKEYDMSFSEFCTGFLQICAGITAVGAACGVLHKLYAGAKKPMEDIDKRLDSIESDIKDIKGKLNRDYNEINQNRDDMNLLMRSMFDLIENRITGNNVEGLKKTRDDLVKALTDK
nr:MAG TPA_asm: hypothetical protein [Caudoviricetes sp.]